MNQTTFVPTALDIALAMDGQAEATSRAIMLATERGDLSPVRLPEFGTHSRPWGQIKAIPIGYALAVSSAKGSVLLVE